MSYDPTEIVQHTFTYTSNEQDVILFGSWDEFTTGEQNKIQIQYCDT
jgi:hypothetical protein